MDMFIRVSAWASNKPSKYIFNFNSFFSPTCEKLSNTHRVNDNNTMTMKKKREKQHHKQTN